MRTVHIIGGVLMAMLAVLPANADEVDESGGHLKIEKPARISDAELTGIYQKLRDRMVGGYALSKYPAAMGYAKWPRYNTTPYLSETHGNRYINNYANNLSKGYGSLKKGDKLPVGSVLAKDSFTVTAERKVFPGALFVMEKLAADASPDTGNWRYIMVMPDGSLFGDSMGDGADQMTFCHDCHKIKANRDFVFFVPQAYRK